MSVTTCVHVAFVWSLWVGELVRVGDRVRVSAGEGCRGFPSRVRVAWLYDGPESCCVLEP